MKRVSLSFSGGMPSWFRLELFKPLNLKTSPYNVYAVLIISIVGVVIRTTWHLEGLNYMSHRNSHTGYVRGSPNGKICKSTNGTVGTSFTNGNQKSLNVFLMPMVPMVPLVDHMVEFLLYGSIHLLCFCLSYLLHVCYL